MDIFHSSALLRLVVTEPLSQSLFDYSFSAPPPPDGETLPAVEQRNGTHILTHRSTFRAGQESQTQVKVTQTIFTNYFWPLFYVLMGKHQQQKSLKNDRK